MAKPTLYTDTMFNEYRKKGCWEETTLVDLWDKNARDYPDGEAIVDSRLSLTWAEAKKRIDRLAIGFLEMGFKKNDVMVLQLPNGVELCLLRLACEKAGLLCVPVLRTWRHSEISYVLERVKAVGIVVPLICRDFDHLKMIREISPRLPMLKYIFVTGDDVPEREISVNRMLEAPLEQKYPPDYLNGTKCRAEEFSLVAATTGTTGYPKFVESPICSRMYMAKVFIERFGITSRDVIGVFSPAVGGVNHPAYFSAPMVHAKAAMLEHFSSREAFAIIEKERITFAGLVPAQLAMMVRDYEKDEYDLSSLRCWYCAGAPLAPQLGREAEDKLKCPIVQCYGAMDSGGMTLHSLFDSAEVRLRTIGKPAHGNEIRLVGDDGRNVDPPEMGEMWARGPTLVSGYYEDPEANAAAWTKDGWYKTGDLGKFDERGNLLIVGRKRDMIIRGGQNIYPVEIENLLLSHHKIVKAALVKMPDAVMGEKACAYVVTAPGEEITYQEMISFLKAKGITAYKLPERLEIIDAMPMVSEGQKIDKKILEQDIAKKLKAAGAGILQSAEAVEKGTDF